MSNRSEMDFCPGVGIGHVSLGDTGVSVLSFAAAGSGAGAVASVDVRGGGPGTRETDLLAPENTVGAVQAIVLAGGSAYGLAAADGAMAELESRGAGFRVFGPDSDGPVVPIVPAAVIFDLAVGDPQHRPTAADGQRATARALDNFDGAASTVVTNKVSTSTASASKASTSNIGAGCGATAGKLRGGFGQASREAAGYRVSAAVVANPVGEVVDAATGRLFGAPERAPVDPEKFADLPSPAASLNTTIGVIATNAPLAKAQLRRLAMCGHDGISWAVRPAHSPLDGDTLFAVSTASEESAAQETALEETASTTETMTTETMTALCAASSQVVCDAIVHAVVHAEPGYGLPTYSQLAKPANSSN
ncbi:P1 family peptidase [Corynebacterium propinquum]|uniref:P1 family peptidase n=1 Tax=Corynebacterium propinquum TaxID=43769 RepID=A0AAP4BTD6_9CORY|nr:P1 family peptidase [Corynebacterium propinquum]MDK4301053.1 P1 family peptidase [Corynebacterium propinquum]MDK4313070.1 P1 family peptidase [Corynebacterium propinquum]MDK4326082.1 P1 family peptidase [Corynebacterium propinquum]MDK8722162.1 P1 family peptidase [Corynebacterium propinquum]RUP77743.1 peptidase S58 family protein [Corynebacterium propinquum]